MAEIKKERKKMGLGMVFLLVVLAVFILWVLTGGPTGSKAILKIKNTEKETTKSSWPATSDIGSYGQVEN